MKRILIITTVWLFFIQCGFALEQNDLRTLFLNNKACIYGINIRTFNANDINGNELIDENEESGNFINAINRLDEIKSYGINTLHLLPITPVSKLKALGTAGSVYAMSDFLSINPQFVDKNSSLKPEEQAALFIQECHKRDIRVIIDLPSCGAYDLFLTHPELFIKNHKQCSIVPTDWTDVRLFNTGNNTKLNRDLLEIHKKFIDMIINLGADGIRADVATIKPFEFWKELIEYARSKSPEFMFLAEASDSWREPPSKYAEFTPYDKLLQAGFDGYYGSFFNLKDWNAYEFIEHIKFNMKLLNSYSMTKSVILSFTTHDEVSPIILHGEKFSIMICWLEATLPYNPYVIDGFVTGDKYTYKWANTKAVSTQTDDDYYFVHRGKLDIFNFSRKPNGNNKTTEATFVKAMEFRHSNEDLITNGDFIALKTNNKNVYAYARFLNNDGIIVVGNLDFNVPQKRIILKNIPFKKKADICLIAGENAFKYNAKNLCVDLEAGEVKVFKVQERK